MENIGHIIEEQLEKKGKSKYQLANETGTPQSGIYANIRSSNPRIKTIKKYIENLDGEIVFRFSDKEYII